MDLSEIHIAPPPSKKFAPMKVRVCLFPLKIVPAVFVIRDYYSKYTAPPLSKASFFSNEQL